MNVEHGTGDAGDAFTVLGIVERVSTRPNSHDLLTKFVRVRDGGWRVTCQPGTSDDLFEQWFGRKGQQDLADSGTVNRSPFSDSGLEHDWLWTVDLVDVDCLGSIELNQMDGLLQFVDQLLEMRARQLTYVEFVEQRHGESEDPGTKEIAFAGIVATDVVVSNEVLQEAIRGRLGDLCVVGHLGQRQTDRVVGERLKDDERPQARRVDRGRRGVRIGRWLNGVLGLTRHGRAVPSIDSWQGLTI